jgi:hypothetical protein
MKLWYDQLKVRALQPALTSVKRHPTEMLDENLSDFDKSRIRLGQGRLKSSARLGRRSTSTNIRTSAQ